MLDKRYALKIKIKSLAAEAKIIRFEERKTFDRYKRDSLAEHRRGIVREEARHTLLAYGFLRGRSYRRLENRCHEAPNWTKVKAMVEKYGFLRQEDESMNEFRNRKQRTLEEFESWKKEKEGTIHISAA